MPRELVVDGVTFRIDQELTAEADPNSPADVREEDMAWSNIRGFGATVPMYRIGCGKMTFAAQITPIAGSGPDVAQWRAGLSQNVTQLGRSGSYSNGARIRFVLPGGQGPPMRDGEPGELPFSYSGTELALGTTTELAEDDEPRLDLPRTVGGAALTETQGADELVTWLALAKEERPRKVVLLGRAVWRVDWDATVEQGQLRRKRPTALSVVTGEQNLSTELTDAPALGDGRADPDYRTEASINSYVIGEMYKTETSRNQRIDRVTSRWRYDDHDRPVASRPGTAPAPQTWFA